ncbi:kelch-like protein 25 [Arctopsyche grandis]|uniref:kelch-like protein 25 n=1 Tax=Arctopsyche grandis TaxID=121162 RepID=UPI00406D80F9
MIKVQAIPGFSNKQIDHLYHAMIEEKFTDVNFAVGNRIFYAHMVVLSACSDIFFSQTNDQLNTIFSDFDYPVIEAILKYCYTGKISIQEKYYENFMKLADILQIKNIAPRYTIINETNCLEALRLSNDPKLKEMAMTLTINNFKTLYGTLDYLKLPASVLTEVLKSDKLDVSSEDVFDSVKLWVNFDNVSRRNKIVNLLSFTKFPMYSTEFVLSEFVDFCSLYPECIAILKQALQTISANCQRLIQDNDPKEDGKIVIVGGVFDLIDASIIDVYSPMFNMISLSKAYEFNRLYYASVVFDNCIMIISGDPPTDERTPSVDYIDLKDGQKHSLKPLNYIRYHSSAVALSNDSSTDVYAIGGSDDENVLSSVERWNSKTKNWDTSVAPLLQPVCYHCASVIGKKIYITGGKFIVNIESISTNKVQVYMKESNSWYFAAPMIQGRDNHASVESKGKLYVAGGYFIENKSILDSVECYDPDANLWTAYCKLPVPVFGPSVCFFRNKLMCIGGHDGKTQLANVWECDDVGKNWKALRSLNRNRYNVKAFVIPHDSII